MEIAAAILVHTIVTRTSGLQQELVARANHSPQAAAEFLRPYYEAALATIKKSEGGASAVRGEIKTAKKVQGT